jgi:hypothetical protein
MKNTGRNASMTLSLAILIAVGCTGAAATKRHARAMKPAPTAVMRRPASRATSDSASVSPNVWELTALAHRKGTSVPG